MGSFWNYVVQLHTLAGPLMMLLYPLYASIQAVESPNKEDDVQWLTYWVLYSFVTLLELALGTVLAWIPIWPTLKLVAACWLVLPQFKGAAYVYEHFVKDHPLKNQLISKPAAISPSAHSKKFESLGVDSRNLASKYVLENGEEAFEKLLRGALKDAKHRGPVYDY
ncbi:HVA22-like protein e [Selaginella moellendorffii]|uniref:HVA22-like protein e n=1 Tax=Selaginella moellendorffii TaxID=88036 RepID=UPI000D1C4451|nr:HVA22-like protein e [Selaginella moellendorffii]|eukprot:XP_024535199.1 HVA22-like protein e [Selaginella moellendorffii]